MLMLTTEMLTTIGQFLDQQNTAWSNNKPWIFYDSDWQVKTENVYDGSGAAIDMDGNIIPNPKDPASKPQANMRTWVRPSGFTTGDNDRDDMLMKMKVR